jgi:hypothetical protein
MLRLDLTVEPRWLDLAHGVRLRVAPLTTALMVAARSDPALEALPTTASDEARAHLRQVDRPDRGLRLGGRRRRRRHAGTRRNNCTEAWTAVRTKRTSRSFDPRHPMQRQVTSQVTLRFTIRAGLQDFSPRQSPLGGFR